MKIKTLLNLNLFTSFFFAFSGYYALLILVSNLASHSLSRMFTIPLRILIILSFFFIYKNTKRTTLEIPGKFFIFFATLYIIRIGIESLNPTILYMSEASFLLYFLSFVVIPFYMLSKIKFSELDYQKIFYSILIGCVGVSILTFFFYGQLIGNVARISQEIDRDENYISPLALSYCAVLGISTGLSFLITNKVSKKKFFLIFAAILVCFLPFFLGASRGAIFAILIPFLLYLTFSKGVESKFRFIGFGIVISFFTIFSTNFLGTGVFDRFTSISDDIDKGSTSAIRLEMWEDGLNQFMDNPFFGNSLQLESIGYYPHNIIIEVLISTGVIGFIPFIAFIYLTFRKIAFMIKYQPQYFWLTSIFFVGLTQNMFSGSIYMASWFALGSSLILGFKNKRYD